MKLQTAKGVRDQSPERQIVREGLIDRLKTVFRKSGFSPLETPMFERYDVLSSKYAGGAEILKETFRFKDQGKRELALRYDLTVPLCRFIGINQRDLKMPFKRYQIGKVFRDGPIKLGRYREFYQCDIDTVGSKSVLAEVQLIEIAYHFFREINLDVDIKINNRKLMNGIMNEAGAKPEEKEMIILTIDKLEKIGEAKVWDELEKKGISEKVITRIFELLKTKKIEELETKINNEEGKTGISELKELFDYLDSLGIKYTFDISLARGLSYYTGTVFEIFLIDNEIKSAVAGGGRYDNMIGNLLSAKQSIPAVGISIGLEVLSDAMIKNDKKTVTQIYIIPIGTVKECLKIAASLREKGYNVDLDISNRGMSKNLNYVNTLKIPYAMIIGEDELKQGKVKVKNMKTGEEKLIGLDDFKL